MRSCARSRRFSASVVLLKVKGRFESSILSRTWIALSEPTTSQKVQA